MSSPTTHVEYDEEYTTMSSEYSDDFEEYTDDFEAYDSDKDDDDDHVSQSPSHQRQHVPPPPPLSRPLSAVKPITSPPRGGLVGAAPATNSFVNGVRAPTGFGLGTMSGGGIHPAKSAKLAAAAESARVKAIRKLVTFEYVNFTLLDMPPKSRYELALLASARVDGGGGTRFSQKETQTGSDLIELAVQTEEVATVSAETQCPDDLVIVVPSAASGGGKEGKKDKKKASSKRTNSGLEWTPQLTRFVIGASQVFDSIMSAAAADTIADEVHDPHAGLVELFSIPIPKDHRLTAIHTPSYHLHLLAYSLCPKASSISARSIIHLTSLKSVASSPAHVLTCWGTISTLSIAPHPRWLVLAGTTDGALLAWDLRKTSTSKRNGSEPAWASYSLLLVQPQPHSISQDENDNAGSLPDPIHSAPIVAIHHLTDRSLVTVDDLGKAAVWGTSLSPSVALVPVTSPTAMSLFPPHRTRRTAHPTDLDPVPYPVVTALDASAASVGMLAATATGSIVRAPGDLLVTSTARATDRYALPASAAAAAVTCMAIVAGEWVVVGTAAGKVCVFHARRGAAPEVVWNVHEREGEGDEETAGVVGMWFPPAGGGGEGRLQRVVVVTRGWVVSWRTEQGKWDMEHVVRVARNKVSRGGNEAELVGLAAGRLAVWEPERAAVVVYNLPVA